MHHSLIPDKQRAALHREYRVRLLATLCAALASAAAIGICALFPAFLRASVVERVALDAVAKAKESGVSDTQTQSAELAADSKLLSTASAEHGVPRISDAITQIVDARSDISLSSIAIDRGASTTISATLQGLAPTRDSLISFKDRLENLAPGASVNLPINELAKSADIRFSIQFTEQLQ